MENKQPDIPFIAFESEMARQERTIKRLWIVILVLIALLAGTNGAWIYYESSFEEEVITVTQENDDGYNNYLGGDGNINN